MKAAELIAEAIGRHQRFALQFSGGKDSLSCLHLLKPYWPRLVVLWSNPGDPYPESLAQMEVVKKLVGEFHEVRGDSFNCASRAYPVDMVPVRATVTGRGVEPEGSNITLQSRYECCWQNFWLPMTRAVHALGITLLFRGQRTQELLRAPIKQGSVDPSGAEICLPIDDWSQQDVLDFLDQEGVELPTFYQFMHAGAECMHCTAYAHDQRGRVAYLDTYHPQVASEYRRRMTLIGTEIAHGVDEMRQNLEELANPVRNGVRAA